MQPLCYICNDALTTKLARPHSHITGKYSRQGATHSCCNLNCCNRFTTVFASFFGKIVSCSDLNNFNFVKEHFNGEEENLLSRKVVYPYTVIDCKEKFMEEQLSPKEIFYVNLNCATLSEEDYEYALTVWEKLNT